MTQVIIAVLGFLFAFAIPTSAAELDLSKLPPPATITVDFDRDVRPILEQSCFRCHGPERPKSSFRLDNRESALKGGQLDSHDVIPGDSARSPLIHYVARLVEDREMPPPAKAAPLTAEQVSILRAWIDQGANWSVTNPYPRSGFSFAPALRWVGVQGDPKKFREIEGIKEGWGAGIEHFTLEQEDGPDRKFFAEGHVLVPDQDVQLKLQWTRNDAGFVRAGYERWRRYYDDTGGFYRPNVPSSFDLDRNLQLVLGRAWIDFGLTLPNWPQIVLGYEYQFKDGTKSMLSWGSTNGLDPNTRYIYPAAKDIDEETHIVKLDLVYDRFGWRFEDNARVEFFHLDTATENTKSLAVLPPPNGFIQTREHFSHVQGQNAIRVERQFNRWLFAYGGYLYSRFDGDTSLNQTTVDATGAPTTGLFWNTADPISLRRESHAFSLASQLGPFDGFNISAAFQAEWTRQDSFGNVNFDEGDPGPPFTFQTNAVVESELDQRRFSEQLTARYTKIRWTVLFAEARWTEDDIGQFEKQFGDELFLDSPSFLRDTYFFNFRQDYRVGFNTSPWRFASFSAHYRRSDSDSDYDHTRDESNFFNGEGYSAFITHREIVTDEVQARVVVRPARWLKTSLTYQRVNSDYTTATDPTAFAFSSGGSIDAGNYDANVYGLNATFVPVQRLSLSGTFMYSDSRTTTWAQKVVPTVIVPYRGNIYSLIAGANYTVNARTAVQLAYSFSQAAYGQNNVAGGLPLGLDYTRHGLNAGLTRQLTKNVTSNLRYSFYKYAEPSTGGVNDYIAHGLFATIAMRWP